MRLERLFCFRLEFKTQAAPEDTDDDDDDGATTGARNTESKRKRGSEGWIRGKQSGSLQGNDLHATKKREKERERERERERDPLTWVFIDITHRCISLEVLTNSFFAFVYPKACSSQPAAHPRGRG